MLKFPNVSGLPLNQQTERRSDKFTLFYVSLFLPASYNIARKDIANKTRLEIDQGNIRITHRK